MGEKRNAVNVHAIPRRAWSRVLAGLADPSSCDGLSVYLKGCKEQKQVLLICAGVTWTLRKTKIDHVFDNKIVSSDAGGSQDVVLLRP